jgi:hypothetical protein
MWGQLADGILVVEMLEKNKLKNELENKQKIEDLPKLKPTCVARLNRAAVDYTWARIMHVNGLVLRICRFLLSKWLPILLAIAMICLVLLPFSAEVSLNVNPPVGTIKGTLQPLSWILQLLGAAIVFGSNVWFYQKARTGKYRNVKKKFVEITATRWAMTEKELEEADADEALRKFPLADLLYRNYRDTVVGIILTLIGVIIGAIIFA